MRRLHPNAQIRRVQAKSLQKTLLPSGTYIIGDPSYQVKEENWYLWNMDFETVGAQPVDSNQKRQPYVFEYKDKLVCCCRTSYGDGVYYDQHDRQYGVDTGQIAAIPIEISELESNKCNTGLGHVMEFKNEFSIDYKDSIISIGDIKINTKRGFEFMDEFPKYLQYCVPELRNLCIEKGLDSSGGQQELVERLVYSLYAPNQEYEYKIKHTLDMFFKFQEGHNRE